MYVNIIVVTHNKFTSSLIVRYSKETYLENLDHNGPDKQYLQYLSAKRD